MASVATDYAVKCKHLWHSTQVYCLTFDRSGQFIITGGDDGLVKIYSTQTDRLVRCLADGSDQQYIDEMTAICRDKDFEAIDPEAPSLESMSEMFAVQDIAVNYENTLVAAAKHTGLINVWNLKTYELIAKLDEQVFPIRSIRFSPFAFAVNRKYLISTSDDGFIYFYAYNDRTLVFTPKSVHRKGKYDGERAVHINGDFSAGGLLYGIIYTFGIPTEVSGPLSKKAKLAPVLSKTNTVQSAIRILNMADESQKEEWKYVQHKNHQDCEYSFRFCHNSFRFATGCDHDSNACIWTFDKANKKWDSILININATQNKKILRGKSKQSTESDVFVDEFIFSCDDKYLITALNDCSVKVWNSESGELVRHFHDQHNDKVSVIECHPKLDHIFLSAGYDGNVYIYDIVTGVVLKQFDCNITVNKLDGKTAQDGFDLIQPQLLQCSFSPDGQTIAATDSLGNMTVITTAAAAATEAAVATLDQLEAELFRIHSESENSCDSQSTPEFIPESTEKDMDFRFSVFEFESELIRGHEKPSPAKIARNDDRIIDAKDKKVVRALDMGAGKVANKLPYKLPSKPSKLPAKQSKLPSKPSKLPVGKPKDLASKVMLNMFKSKTAAKPAVKEPAVDTKLPKLKPEVTPVVPSKSTNNKGKPLSTPTVSSSTTSSPIGSKTAKPGKQDCRRILDEIFENPASRPFHVIDHIQWPTYRKEIADADLSLSQIKINLLESCMSLRGFNTNMNHLIENSKKFFRHKDLEIYELAIDLEKYFCKKMRDTFGAAFKEPEPVSDSEDEEQLEDQKSETTNDLDVSKNDCKVAKPSKSPIKSPIKSTTSGTDGDQVVANVVPITPTRVTRKSSSLANSSSSGSVSDTAVVTKSKANSKTKVLAKSGGKPKSASKSKKPSVTPKRKAIVDMKSVADSAKRSKTNDLEELIVLDDMPDIEIVEPINPQRKSSQESQSSVNGVKKVSDNQDFSDDLSPNELVIASDVETSEPINGLIESQDQTATDANCDITDSSKKSLFCLYCDELFGDKRQATTHYLKHMCPLKCVQCRRQFEAYDHYLTHGDGCTHPKTPVNLEWSRHYDDTIVWITGFLDYQLTDEFRAIEVIEDIDGISGDKSCIVCQKVKKLRLNVMSANGVTIDGAGDHSSSKESHIERHLKYEKQYQCLICSLKEDKYFYCNTTALAREHLLNEHKSYADPMGGPTDALRFFDPSIPILNDIIMHFNS